MSLPAAGRFCWAAWGVCVALQASSLVLWALAGFPTLPGYENARASDLFWRLSGVISGLTLATVGVLIASRHPRNPVGWMLSFVAVQVALTAALGQYATTRAESLFPGAPYVLWALVWLEAAAATCGVWIILLIPDGRLPSARWQPLVWVIVLCGGLIALGGAFKPGPFLFAPAVENPLAITGWEAVLYPLRYAAVIWALPLANVLAATSLLVRLRSATGELRQQLKWVAFPAVFYAVAIAGTYPLPMEWMPVLGVVHFFALLVLTLSLGVAVLKYHLWDVDLVLDKALVYGSLAVCVTGLYIVVVAGIGVMVGRQGESNLIQSLLATALVAVLFQPLRERIQHLANRLVYGHRASPYEVLADFSRRMAGALSVDEVLPRTAEAAARGAGATRARVRVYVPGGADQVVVWPNESVATSFSRVEMVLHQGSPVGEIAIVKPPGEPLTTSEAALLADLAAQAGPALSNVRLALELRAQADELRASRQRIVTAQDAERRRIERDIHDGAQQHLVAIAVTARLAAQTLARDPATAATALNEIGAQADEALSELRDLARGIFPPLLADRGLGRALQAHLTKTHPLARLEMDGAATARFPQEVEAAVYFCCREALQNAAKYAPDAPLSVRLELENGALTFAVVDHGPGFDPATVPRGSGLQGMADRIAAVGGSLGVDSTPGGGTTVSGRVPVSDCAAHLGPRASDHNATRAAIPNSAFGR